MAPNLALWGYSCLHLTVYLGKFPFQWCAPFPWVLWAESRHVTSPQKTLLFSIQFFRIRDASENWQTGTCLLVLANNFLRSCRHYSGYKYHYQHYSQRCKLQWASVIAVKVTKICIHKITFNITSVLPCTFPFPIKILYEFLLPISRFAFQLSKPLFSTKLLRVHVLCKSSHTLSRQPLGRKVLHWYIWISHPRINTRSTFKIESIRRMPSSGMWSRVDLVWTDVSEESIVSIFKVPLSRIFLPWRWRRYVPSKRPFTQDPHGATSQKTAFFIVTAVKTSNLT
jgi:hypothetical protein